MPPVSLLAFVPLAWSCALALALAQVGGAAAAWAGGRPPECGDLRGRSANVWERAKAPELAQYCDLLARASSRLAGVAPMAQQALEAARQAESVGPTRAAPHVLEGRALAALGRYPEALAALTEARRLDAAALDEPAALLAWARALARTGRARDAADAYRVLMPRASALPPTERVCAQIEAGLTAMARGRAGLDEAAAALREAVRDGRSEPQSVAVLALALALDRAGDARGAKALFVARPQEDPREVLASSRARELLAVAPAESHALAAIALEWAGDGEARGEWQQAAAAEPSGPWADYARAHAKALSGAGRPAAGGAVR